MTTRPDHLDVDDIADWRAEVQETIYLILEEVVTESRASMYVLRESREELSRALVYGSYSDVATLIDRLLDSIEQAVAVVQKVVGQFDPPGQVAATLREPIRDRSAMEIATEGMDSVQREKLSLILRSIFAESRKALTAAGTPVSVPLVPEVMNAEESPTIIKKSRRRSSRTPRTRTPGIVDA